MIDQRPILAAVAGCVSLLGSCATESGPSRYDDPDLFIPGAIERTPQAVAVDCILVAKYLPPLTGKEGDPEYADMDAYWRGELNRVQPDAVMQASLFERMDPNIEIDLASTTDYQTLLLQLSFKRRDCNERQEQGIGADGEPS